MMTWLANLLPFHNMLHAVKFWKGWNRGGGWKGGIGEVGGKGGTGEVGASNLGEHSYETH